MSKSIRASLARGRVWSTCPASATSAHFRIRLQMRLEVILSNPRYFFLHGQDLHPILLVHLPPRDRCPPAPGLDFTSAQSIPRGEIFPYEGSPFVKTALPRRAGGGRERGRPLTPASFRPLPLMVILPSRGSWNRMRSFMREEFAAPLGPRERPVAPQGRGDQYRYIPDGRCDFQQGYPRTEYPRRAPSGLKHGLASSRARG
jgi:hypothetical protein